MKVIIIINSLGSGGAERSMVEFVKYLQKHDEVEVMFVCFHHRKIGLEKEVADFGIKINFFQGKDNFYNKTKFLNAVIEEEKPDIIHSVLVESNLILRLSRIFKKHGKVIQSLVNTPYSLERKKDTNLPWQKFLIAKQFDIWTARLTPNLYYHAITREVLEHYKPLYRIKENYKIIYRGRSENPYYKPVNSGSSLNLINVGRQEFAKGQINILKALLLLKNEHNITDIFLSILGRPGQSSEELEAFIENNNLSGQVAIHGFVSDVDLRLVNADIFIFPSYYEGLGGALIEAFSAKLPCVCSEIPVLQEVVGTKDGALFSPPGNFQSLAANILQLYRDNNLRKKLSEYSFKRFNEVFRIEKINDEMLQMYKEVLGSRK